MPPFSAQPRPPQAASSGSATLLAALERKSGLALMSLADALLDLGLMDSAQIATLADEDKELLGDRCTELVSRGLLTRRQLGRPWPT